jgi:fucose permease
LRWCGYSDSRGNQVRELENSRGALSADNLIELLQEIGQMPLEEHDEGKNSYRNIFKTKNVHLLAWFCLIYVGGFLIQHSLLQMITRCVIGVEVTTGGWIVTYIIEKRGGGPSSGYVSSGFFGGLTLGRVGLLWLNKWVRNPLHSA